MVIKMIAPIVTYKNIYFDFYVNFPDDWSFRTESKIKGEIGIQYQASDDDLPRENCAHKVLFFATYQKKNALFERCNFSVSVHRFKDSFDLLKFSQEKVNVIDCKYSQTFFLGRDAQEVIITQEYSEQKVITKVITWMEFPDIWLSAIAEGDSSHNFEEAERLFYKMYRIAS
jgi:hypothetical protein